METVPALVSALRRGVGGCPEFTLSPQLPRGSDPAVALPHVLRLAPQPGAGSLHPPSPAISSEDTTATL